MNDNEIKIIYNEIVEYYNKYLKNKNVKLPRLSVNGKYTKNALCLVYLARDYPKTHIVSKRELTKFVRKYYPTTNDVQQGRHLAQQQGWFIESGQRGDIKTSLKSGEYKLITLKCSYPHHRYSQKSTINLNWDALKEMYGNRCATCGSKEGEPNYHYPNSLTKLQKGHLDPSKPLTNDNIIPQCDKCNRADRNNWIYDKRGRVIAVANENVVKKSSKEVREKIYDILKKEFRNDE